MSKEVLSLIKQKNIEFVDLRFTDFLGTWQHVTIPVSEINEECFTNGFGFDGSSIRGWKGISESDMLLIPNADTAFIDPFFKVATVVMVCTVLDPITKEKYERDPRNVAQKAEAYLKSTGIADTAYFGPELEFFIFDDVRFGQNSNNCYYHIDSDEGIWNSGTVKNGAPNLGHRPRHKEGYYPVPPTDSQQDIRSEMVLELQKAGVRMEAHHHEVATGGQGELAMRFAPLTQKGDQVMLYKYILKNVAKRHGQTVTFMPKPLHNDNGTGMHTHQSIWKAGQNLFAGNGYGGMSEIGLYYIGGILKHSRALAAITNCSTNSYKRLVPGFEAPVNLAYSSRNRSASIRIPVAITSAKAKRIEVRYPDATCNPYFAFAAMLMAGLDGVQNKINPGAPLDKNLYDLPPEEAKNIPVMPGSLEESLHELEKDHDFLLKGDVFTEDIIQTWIDYKREKEAAAVASRPHPYEFHLYYDA